MIKLMKKCIGSWLKIQRKTHLDRYYNHLSKRQRFTREAYIISWSPKAWNTYISLSYFYSQPNNMIFNKYFSVEINGEDS